ncbi:hypothetical protein COOONC_10814 [Cooperia oncophora]
MGQDALHLFECLGTSCEGWEFEICQLIITRRCTDAKMGTIDFYGIQCAFTSLDSQKSDLPNIVTRPLKGMRMKINLGEKALMERKLPTDIMGKLSSPSEDYNLMRKSIEDTVPKSSERYPTIE